MKFWSSKNVNPVDRGNLFLAGVSDAADVRVETPEEFLGIAKNIRTRLQSQSVPLEIAIPRGSFEREVLAQWAAEQAGLRVINYYAHGDEEISRLYAKFEELMRAHWFGETPTPSVSFRFDNISEQEPAKDQKEPASPPKASKPSTPNDSPAPTAAPATGSTKRRAKNVAFKELNAMIGLAGVKQEIESHVLLLNYSRNRARCGFKTPEPTKHLAFVGNPGTGKTTVARLLADIYRDTKIVKRGHLVEADRSSLVGKVIGETAKLVTEIVESALDGVLFIDEAYSLMPSSERDFGHEAISTLIKLMEDYRDRLVVIIAGYPNEISALLEANPGMKSRFKKSVAFADYSPEELGRIFVKMAKDADYKLDKSAATDLLDLMEWTYANRDEHFGNGRAVRGLFENMLERHARRLLTIENPSKDDYALIKSEDLPVFPKPSPPDDGGDGPEAIIQDLRKRAKEELRPNE